MADIEGVWVEPEFESSLIQLCRENWKVPISDLSNHALATYIRQRLGLKAVVPEALRRIERGYSDDSELYDDELANAIGELA
ncbi:hypothetical protein H3H37_00305 [Duganella sp. LX20W]|uniref:Uncharacterized protein n=1 Tax=Rugamonas brunnea TaxID=2758569 RepID=A0A7W2ENC0_9BURK|nr:contact-dependent growth inhibition system immunity protein [Rugamonas brunnea]MBA5635510.1 hypothetical protein [Rugamonas brunnea]